MALQIGMPLLQTMTPSTVIAMIDDMPTVITALQADIHGLPIVYTYEEAQTLFDEVAAWGKVTGRQEIHSTIDLINKRIQSLHHHHDRHETIWTSSRKWERQCQEWEQQHQIALKRVRGLHGGGMNFG